MIKNSKLIDKLATLCLTSILIVGGSLSVSATDAPAMSKKGFGDCEVTDHPTIHKLKLLEDGVVNWKVPLPTPGGGIIGDTPDTITGGTLYCFAAEIANRAGATSIKTRNTTFEAIIAGADSNFDFSIWDVIITPERQKVVDFSIPYHSMDSVVVGLKGSDVTADNLKEKRIGTLNGARQASMLEQQLKPSHQLRAFNTNQDMITALIAGQIDVFVHDTDGGILFAAENEKQGLVPLGRLPLSFDVGVVLPKGSPNTPVINQIIQDMKADGSLQAIYDKWYYPGFKGMKPENIPVWEIKG